MTELGITRASDCVTRDDTRVSLLCGIFCEILRQVSARVPLRVTDIGDNGAVQGGRLES
jgi:hypothetical protein